MPEDQKKQLQAQLWKIANELRGKMDADEFRDYILGFIFYKFLSEKMCLYANEILEVDGIEYSEINEKEAKSKKIIEAVKKEAVDKLGYFLKPSELYSSLVKKSTGSSNILEDFDKIYLRPSAMRKPVELVI